MCTTSQIPDYVQIAEIMKTSTDMVEGLGKLFKFFDENGDGKLSKVEAQNGFEMIGKWEGAMKDDFEAMAGEDGKVPIEGETKLHTLYKILHPAIISCFFRIDEQIEAIIRRLTIGQDSNIHLVATQP